MISDLHIAKEVSGRFIPRRFVSGRFVSRRFVSGRFVSGRFVFHGSSRCERQVKCRMNENHTTASVYNDAIAAYEQFLDDLPINEKVYDVVTYFEHTYI